MQLHTGFILTRNWRDTERGIELELWLSTEAGPQRLLIPAREAVFFVPRPDLERAREVLAESFAYRLEELELQDFRQDAVLGFYFHSQRQLRQARDRLQEAGLDPLEADINPVERFLMERFVEGSLEYRQEGDAIRVRRSEYHPQLRVLSVDIETAMSGIELYSIAAYALWDGEEVRRVFMRGEGADLSWVDSYASERELLSAFCDWVQQIDPDVLVGWNVINFDLWFLQRLADKLSMRLPLGRGRRQAHWRDLDDEGERKTVQLPGRVVLDGIETLRTATYRFESFSLENVSRELLGSGKLLKGGQRGEQIGELFNTDKNALAEYNLRDCELVWQIFEHTGLLEFAVARSQMTGLAMDRLGGSVAAFDHLYLPRLHRAGFVAPNASREQVASPGGFVLDSQPGIYDDVLVLDFKSLYPSIIRTFLIDPYGLAAQGENPVPGFAGASFSRDGAILPELIASLWAVRDEAKRVADAALSQAVKILMNSFYGVLGASGCRFHDHRLATSITRRGHEIIQKTRELIEARGHEVIYGDTDSLFVLAAPGGTATSRAVAAPRDVGRALTSELNAWWREHIRAHYQLESQLEIEFETHFARFLMPTVRGDTTGSKKRYAGLVRDDAGAQTLVFKGLESVRTDWTPLARRFQRELYRRVFLGEPYEPWIGETLAGLLDGRFDHELVYAKKLRRPLSDYARSAPPHVQAARQVAERGERVGKQVRYVITASGPQALPGPQAGSEPDSVPRPDYAHYRDRQLAPAADGILGFLGTSFDAITDPQLEIFQ